MSKKEKRRAARQAFPKAKTATGARGRAGAGARNKSSAGARGRAAAIQGPKPPTIKRAVIQGAILAFLYFALIQWIWPNAGTTTKANVIIAFGLFFVYSGIAYALDRFKYRRKVGKTKNSSK